MKKKKYKIRGLENVLKDIPVEERFALGHEIKKAFANFDPSNPPSKPVIPVEPGTRMCPDCGGKLVQVAAIEKPIKLHFLNCENCDNPFSETMP